MKKLSIFLIGICVSTLTLAQDSLFSAVHSSTAEYTIISQDIDDHFHFAHVGGYDYDKSVYSYVDSLGNILHSKTYSIDGQASTAMNFNRAVTLSDGNFLIMGNSYYESYGITTGIIMKIDSIGNVIWSNIGYSVSTSSFRFRDAIELPNNNLVAIGSDEYAGDDAVVFMDPAGTLLSSYGYKINGDILNIRSIKALSDTTFAIVGSASTQTSPIGVAFVIDQNGQILWNYTVANSQFFEAEVNNESIWIAGALNGPMGLISMTHSGSVSSVNTYSNYVDNGNVGLTIIEDSTLAFVSGSPFQGFMLTATINTLDAQLSYLRLNATDVSVTQNKGLMIAGNGPLYGVKIFAFPHTGIIRTDSLLTNTGCIDYTQQEAIQPQSISNLGASISSITGIMLTSINVTPTDLTVSRTAGCVDTYGGLNELENQFISVYPVPANDKLTIQITSEKTGQLRIFSADGKLVLQSAIDSSFSELQIGTLSSGCYTYVFANERKNEVYGRGKIVIEK